MTAFEPKAHLTGLVKRMQHFMTNDLQAIPADKVGECPGGCARPALSLVVEVCGTNRYIAGILTGSTDRPTPEEREAYAKQLDTVEKALAELNVTCDVLVGAIEGFDEGRLGDTTDGFMGFPMTYFAIAELAGMHIMYHDGQLNYIQTLHGDDKMHWF